MRYQEGTPTRELTSSCQWDTQWSRVSSSFTCTLTYCPKTLALPSNSLVEEVSQEWHKLGEEKLLRCPSGAHLLEATATKEEAREEFNMTCRNDGTYVGSEEWMRCRFTVFCPASPEPPRGGRASFLTHGEGSTKYLTKIEYACTPGSQFQHGGEYRSTVESSCTWAATWAPHSTLPPCHVTHCPSPPSPPPGHYMEEATSNWTAVGDHKVMCSLPDYLCYNYTYFKYWARFVLVTSCNQCTRCTGARAVSRGPTTQGSMKPTEPSQR